MYLKQLIINNYKNLEQVKTDFTRGINCFVGYNGAGKTNLLSAIYYLSACKDYFNLPDSQNILNDNDFFIIDGHFSKQDSESERVYCGVQRDRGKTMSLNGKDYQRLSDHIGYIPLVMITPSDTMVIHTGSEDRRRMLNFMISQFDRSYLNMVIQYNKVIENRNKALKGMRETRQTDELTLEMYDVQLIKYGTAIHKTRKTFMENFIDIFQRYYTLISGNNEKVGLQYNSQLNNGEFETMLKQARTADLTSGYTTVGIHKDDLEFTIDTRAVKKSASQGQQKTFIIAIKLAYYDYSASKTEIKPLLLLDDIFDKLDSIRVSKIVALVSADHFGQIFITDANKVRMENILKDINSDYKIFSVTCGEVQLQYETSTIEK
ncbi:MAG: DNA replication and repair protein RecF [Salinivirgaceae bacterium]|nr:DNA replication and repair protein RecF [Salinivirgaceae bacterium]MDD4746759.1 DNA replication and repair protein RecF [Salinivirgaceae bacterium]MDY0281154.1 DNA replication and repair protein RecF [Salinivirgaceae bacterium]